MRLLTMIATLLFALSLCAQQPAAKDSKAEDDMKDCPMHAQRAKAHEASDVDKRGDVGMGFSHEKTGHHFRLAADGGSIETFANDAKDDTSITAIRQHMRHIAMMFSAGDFSTPMFVHDAVPPGVPVMQANKRSISYRYEELPLGARVVIKTANEDALKAVQEFLKFQIREHRTGDSSSAH